MEKRLREATLLLAEYYRAEGRTLPWREGRDPYRVWLSEIMLQQTRVEAVIPYYHRFLSRFPDVYALAAATDEQLYKCWEGLGYYSRARNLRESARQLAAAGGVFPDTVEGWLALPGIGGYTAGAISSICLGLPTPAVDGNVLRILARLFASREEVTSAAFKRDCHARLSRVYPRGEDAAAVTQGFMELGQRLCLPNGAPKCEGCPLASLCLARAEGVERELPVRAAKKQRKVCNLTILLCHKQGKFAVRRRPDEGLLSGLWEFPSRDGHLTEAEAAEAVGALGLTPTAIIALPDAKHIFTHIEWRMQGYLCDCEGEGDGLCFATPDEIRDSYPIATAFRAYKEHILRP